MSDRYLEGFADGRRAERLNCNALTAERDRLAKRLAEEERNHEQTLIERDRYAEAISAAHVAAGGDGEWVAKIPPEDLPHSGDLAADVPEMVRALAAERDRLALRVKALENALRDILEGPGVNSVMSHKWQDEL